MGKRLEKLDQHEKSSKVVVACNFIILFMLFLTSGSALALHFEDVSGNPNDSIWTVYLAGAGLENEALESGDEIALFDGELMVGSFVLTETLTEENHIENFFTAWATLHNGPGYTPGNTYTFKCWDESETLESEDFEITLAPSEGAYTGVVFPEGEVPYSIVTLNFTGGEILPTVIIDELDGVNLSEGGISDEYSIVLSVQPTNTVTITITYDEQIQIITGMYSTKKTSLLRGVATIDFTTDNWDQPRTITVSAIDDQEVEGEHNSIINHTAVGGGYDDINIEEVMVTISDNDYARRFRQIQGNPEYATWTIYLSGAAMDETALEAGDEIGIFDGDTLVGSYLLSETLTPANQFENNMKAWEIFHDGPGYTPGNPYTFKCWDASNGVESDSFIAILSDEDDEAYTGNVFPEGEIPFSMAELSFETYNSISGYVLYRDNETPLSDITITLFNQSGKRESLTTETTTSETGYYSFSDIPGGIYTIRAFREPEELFTIDNQDWDRTAQLYWPSTPVDPDNDELIAADANNDGRINIIDLQAIGNHTLFVGEWRFRHETGDELFEEIAINLSTDLTDQNFIGILIGDVATVQITREPDTTGEIGEEYNGEIRARDWFNSPDALTIDVASTVPYWLTFTDTGQGIGTFAGTPASEDIGEHAITIDAVGANNISKEAEVIIRVNGNIYTAETDNATIVAENTDPENEDVETDIYSISLRGMPESDVQVSITLEGPDNQIRLSEDIFILTFTPTTWNIPQEIPIRVVNDIVFEETGCEVIIRHALSSEDPLFNEVAAPSVTVAVLDNDANMYADWRVADFNGDRCVDSIDLTTLLYAYGSQPGDTNWNPECDIATDGNSTLLEGDHAITFFDLVILSYFYGVQDGLAPNTTIVKDMQKRAPGGLEKAVDINKNLSNVKEIYNLVNDAAVLNRKMNN